MQELGLTKAKVRSALREATRAVHERLHHAPAFAAIANQQLDMREYTKLLTRIATFHFAVGRDLDTCNARAQLLARDLEALGSPEPERMRWSSPKTSRVRLGLTYVLEGSSLGGKVIYRQLDYLFGQSAEGRRFFRGSASDGRRWQAFCRHLEAEGQAPGAVVEMICGAMAAFALFEQLVACGGDHG
jgi:heme oxygenase (biliverdin-IX-beta and delta-forming)